MSPSDLVLLIYIVFLVPAMLVGWGFARRKLFIPQHRAVMTTITIINWILIFGLMLITYRRDVAPQLPDHLTALNILIPSIHLITGLIAQLLATYLVIRMWFSYQLPNWLKIVNIKTPMRLTLGLWLATAVLGMLTWAVLVHGVLLPVTPANAASTPAANVVQMINGDMYSPTHLTVTVGTTVHFVNQSATTHTVSADDNSFDSGDIAPGKSWDHTFTKAGDVPFTCGYHGPAMAGVITVK